MHATSTTTQTVTIGRKDLADVVRDAKTSRNHDLPILSGLSIRVNAGTLSVEGTDLKTTVRRFVHNVATPFVSAHAVVSAKALADTLKGRGNADIGLTFGDGEILCNGATLRTMPADDFPALADDVSQTGEHVGTLEPWQYRKLLSSVSGDTARPILTAIHAKRDGATVTFASTDSYRLSTVTVPAASDTFTDVLMAAEGLRRKKAHLVPKSDLTDVFTDGAHSVWRSRGGKGYEMVRTIAGTFPNYRQLINPPTHTFTTDPAGVVEAVKACPRALHEDYIPIRIAADGTLKVSRQDVGEWQGRVPGWQAPCDTAFNVRYLIDAFDHWASDVTVGITDGLKPMHIVADGALGLIMPVRV